MSDKCVIRGCQLRDYERDRYACLRCTEGIRRHLREIEIYAFMLPSFVAPGRGSFGRNGAQPRHERSPVNLDVLVALDPRSMRTVSREPDPMVDDDEPIRYVWDEIWSMCRMVAEERDESDPGSALWYLLTHTDWCAHQPWIDEHANAIAALHAQLRGLARDTPPPPLAPCLSLGCAGMVFWSRDVPDPTDPSGRATLDAAKCSRCGRTYAGVDLVRLRAQLAG